MRGRKGVVDPRIVAGIDLDEVDAARLQLLHEGIGKAERVHQSQILVDHQEGHVEMDVVAREFNDQELDALSLQDLRDLQRAVAIDTHADADRRRACC